ncbi:alpha/beta fold hydrolase [Phaeovibrio sulfidiphilus]|uniref:Alpha/beta fold hydrolase n=1 Tax=Phaeovibrio sulfidiphilus TaxID=1220600 RepID=A0A8J6YMP8_9PROT|nr:alpha/beta fold hydrolase [Phaeovibrio sulfidiphilus]MBE1236146.1 alpha/beta fold hydrolase [Phaeovibrio sulfidiphilus]
MSPRKRPPAPPLPLYRTLPVRLLALAVSLVLIVVALVQLLTPLLHIQIERDRAGTTPVTVFRPATNPGPPVVVSHGFAGSRSLMQTYALALARDGYTVVTYDSLGHGSNPEPLAGDLDKPEGATAHLLAQLDQVVDYARALVPGEQRVALLGHSMATDILVRHTVEHPDTSATIALSLYSPEITAQIPHNLLVLVGALEQGTLKGEAMKAVGMVAGLPRPEPGVTYGQREDNTLRRWDTVPGVEHVGILFSTRGAREAADWLDFVLERPGTPGAAVAVLPWVALLLAGTGLLGWFLFQFLPRATPRKSPPSLKWGPFLLLALVPAVLTPPVARMLPTDFLPTLVGDYLMVHCALYGLFTALGLALWRRLGRGAPVAPRSWPVAAPRTLMVLALSTLLVTAYTFLGFIFPTNDFITVVIPGASRLPVAAFAVLAVLPFILADETLVRAPSGTLGAAAVTRLLFLLSLGAAIALDFQSLFFLIVLLPLLAVFLLIYMLISWWAWRQTGHVLPGAIAEALGLSFLIAAAFPIVSG